MVTASSAWDAVQAVGRGDGSLEEDDAGLGHVGLVAALNRERDARSLERCSRVEREALGLPSRPVHRGMEHDGDVSFDAAAAVVGRPTAERLRDLTLDLYRRAAEHAADCGLILADTKFEFGVDPTGGPSDDAGGGPALRLCDEALTPDSSRYWPADRYAPGGPQPSYDKQYVRDWLLESGWDRESPPPPLPADVAARTAEKYRTSHRLLTGRDAP